MKIACYAATDVGQKRTRNEDSHLMNNELGLFLIADGMGGHSGGQFASRMAVVTIEEVIQSMRTDPEATVISGVNTEEADHGDQLRYAIEMASSRIFDRALYDSTLKGMGTTTVACLYTGNRAYLAHVGDSRAYYFHANKMRQATKDHSLVSEQLEAGIISEQDAKNHKLKNIITRSVGYQEEVEIDVQKLDVHMGDKILLCSDGLTNMVDDADIQRIVNGAASLELACKELIKRANERGGEDNVTVLLTEVLELDK